MATRRRASTAPPGPTDAAVGDAAADAPSDAPTDTPTDTPTDLERCPTRYDITIGASKYRLRDRRETFAQHYAACADDTREGLTHLVVLSGPEEAAALRADPSVCGPGNDNCASFWTGLFSIDGTRFTTATNEPPWVEWDTDQPDDIDQVPVAATYNPLPQVHASSDTSVAPGTDSIRSICECDGRRAVELPFPPGL